MTVSRMLFEVPLHAIATVTADSGIAPSGFLHMINWVSTTADTGVVMNLSWHPRAGDTGDGKIVYTVSGVNTKFGAAGFVDFPRQPVTITGADFTSNDSGAERWPFVAGDRLKVMFTNDSGTNNFAGRLYCYFSDN
jgi:hypothetical protein